MQGIVITAGMASNAVIRDVKTRLLANLSDANAKPDESMEVDERGNEQDSKIAYASLLASLMRSASTGKKFSNVLEKCLPGLLALTENVNDQNGEAVETGLTVSRKTRLDEIHLCFLMNFPSRLSKPWSCVRPQKSPHS